MNAFHNLPYVMSTNNQRAKGVEPLLCYDLSSRYGNRDTSKISWKCMPLLQPASCMFPKVQRPVVVSEDFLKTGGRPSTFPTKTHERSSADASRSVLENFSGTDNHVKTCHGKGADVPFEGSYGHRDADSTGHRDKKGDEQRLGVYGADICRHSIHVGSKVKDNLPDSNSKSSVNSAEKLDPLLQCREQRGDANNPGWIEKMTNEKSSSDGASKVGDGKAQTGSTIKFNRMIHFREKLSLLQQQQQQQQNATLKFDGSLKPKLSREPTAAEGCLSLGDKPETKARFHPDEKHWGEPESRSQGNEHRKDNAEPTLLIFPQNNGHEPLPQRALLQEKVGSSGQKESVQGPTSACGANHDVVRNRDGGKCGKDIPGASEPTDTQTDDRTDAPGRGEGSLDFLSNYGRTNKKRRRVRRHQRDDQSSPSSGDVEPMNTDEQNAIGRVKMDDVRGTKRQIMSHHGSPDPKKSRSCFTHDPLPIGLQHDTHRPIRRKHSKTSIGSTSPIAAANPSNPFGIPSSKQDALSSYMWDFYERHQQTKETYVNKMRLRDELYALTKTVFPYCGLYVIGSSMNGFGSNHSDMDLCLMLSHNEIDQKKEATDILRVLKKTLSLCSFLRDIRLIQAKVPILKFTDSISRVECDLNINNSVGIRNTHLLNAYSSLDWRVPPLVLFIKQWAKSWDINDASQGSISSYSLALMVIHYLQQGCRPHLLPSLQQKYPHKFDETTDIRSLTLNERLAPYASPNHQSLGELFVGFINYFTCRFSFEKEAISVRLGRSVPENLVHQFLPKLCNGQWKYICIEEPFNLTNTAYSVFDSKVFGRILDVFRGTNSLLVFGDGLVEPSCIIKEVKDFIARETRGSVVAIHDPRSITVDNEESTARVEEATTFTTVDIFTAGTLTVPKSSRDLRVALIAPLAAPAAVATDAAVLHGGMNLAFIAPLVYRSRLF